MLLDDILPAYEFGEAHGTRVSAPPPRALEAAKLATPGEMPLVRLLFGIRSLPAIFSRGGGLPSERALPLWDQMLASGFVLLAEEPGREVVGGVIGRMWRPGGGLVPPVRDARGFVAFEKPGYAKAAFNFSAETEGCRYTRLRTETRVVCTDPDARRKFARYWRMIRPGSAAIRRSWLRAARRRADGVRP